MIAKIVLFMCLLLLPTQVWAEPALDGTPTGSTNSGSTTLTWSHTCTAGSVTVFSVGNFNSGSFSSVAYNGVTADALFTGDNSGGASTKQGLYMAVSGCDGAAHNVTVTLSGTMDGYTAGAAASYSGVVTSSVAAAHRTVYNGGAGGGGGAVIVVDSQSGDYVVAGIANYKVASTITADGNARITQSPIPASNLHHGLQDYSASGGNTSTSWTNAGHFTQSATALIPASGGGGATVHNLMMLGVGQ